MHQQDPTINTAGAFSQCQNTGNVSGKWLTSKRKLTKTENIYKRFVYTSLYVVRKDSLGP